MRGEERRDWGGGEKGWGREGESGQRGSEGEREKG